MNDIIEKVVLSILPNGLWFIYPISIVYIKFIN